MIRISPPELRRRAELALMEGTVLREWSERIDANVSFFPLQIERGEDLSHRADGFFGEIEFDGSLRSAMGCRQQISIEPGLGPSNPDELHDFVFRDFLAARPTSFESRTPHGFTTKAVPTEGTPIDLRTSVPDWRELGSDPLGAILSIELHDFELRAGPLILRPRQIVYVVQHSSFMSEHDRPAVDVRSRVKIGYPFVPFAPLRNPFGFGPGKFGAAIKQFTFSLRAGGAIDIEMLFIAAPRCKKVVDVFGLPDPIFGTVKLLELATLGLMPSQPRRDRLEKLMLETHCRVHGKLIESWVERWLKDSQRHDAGNVDR